MDADRIIEVLRRIGAEKISLRGKDVWCSCPLSEWEHEAGTDHHPSCAVKIVDDDSSVFICWGCKAHGRFSDLIHRISVHTKGMLDSLVAWVEENDQPNLDRMLERAVEERDVGGLYLPSVKTPPERILDERDLKVFLGGVPRYIVDRGIDLGTCKVWKLGYDEDRRDPRLVFPCWDLDQNLVGIVGRSLLDGHPQKYKNYIGFESGKFLYGEHLVESGGQRPLLMVEGMIDVLNCWQADCCQPLGIFGSRMTKHRAAKIQILAGSKPVFTLFDPDKAGSDARDSVDRFLRGSVPVIHMRCPPDRDPGEMGEEEIRRLFNAF